MLQNSTTDVATTQSKFGRRFDEECKREVVTLATRAGASDPPVARDLGVSPYRVGRWKKQDGSTLPSCSPGVSVQELERRIRSLARENADLREQRTILKKSSRHLLRTPAMKIGVIRSLAGHHPARKLCRTLGVVRSAYYAAQKKAQRPRTKEKRTRVWARRRARFSRPVDAPTAVRGSPWRCNAPASGVYDNAKMESFRATMKTELIDGQGYNTRAEAKSAVLRYIEVFYNRRRLPGALGFYSPVDFEHNLN